MVWEIWEAPTTDDRVCRTFFELRPPLATSDFGNVSIPGQIEREGARAVCGPRADLFGRADPVEMLGSWHASASYWSIAGTTAPEISALDVELEDGRTIRVPVDAQSHVFTLFNRDALRVTEVRPDAGAKASITCSPEDRDGFGLTRLNCSGTVHR